MDNSLINRKVGIIRDSSTINPKEFSNFIFDDGSRGIEGIVTEKFKNDGLVIKLKEKKSYQKNMYEYVVIRTNIVYDFPKEIRNKINKNWSPDKIDEICEKEIRVNVYGAHLSDTDFVLKKWGLGDAKIID